MKTRNAARAMAVAVILSSTGCASIVSKSTWPVTVQTNPSGAKCNITDKSGMPVVSGETPMTLNLKSSSGFFSSAKYSIFCKKEGYQSTNAALEAHLNGWYWGNLVFGGVIGLLIVDPATGAMWKMEETPFIQLAKLDDDRSSSQLDSSRDETEAREGNLSRDDSIADKENKKLWLKTEDTIAILPFSISANKNNYNFLSQGFSEDLTYYLMKNDGIKILDRNTVDKVLSEIKFNNSGIVDSATAQNIGKILGAKFIITGNVEVINNEANVICRVIKVETCENVLSEKVVGHANEILSLRERLGKKMNARLQSK